MRRIYFLMVCMGMVLMPLLMEAKIVVLTEEPVAEFALPDGSVLKNAFVWKRNSEGLMIIHDDGQYYLNFRTLPDDWRAAYAVMDGIGQVAVAASERDDQYLIFDVIPKIEGLHHQAVTFYKSKRYPREIDDALLTACALQCFLDFPGEPTRAKRICRDIKRIYPEYPQIDVDALYEPCIECDEVGSTIYDCPTGKGSGKCRKCEGDGELDPEFEHAEPKHCTTCRGTGKCPRCSGTTNLKLRCGECKGVGKKLRRTKVKARLAVEVERLNKYHADFGQ
jgi:hypothetical protein